MDPVNKEARITTASRAVATVATTNNKVPAMANHGSSKAVAMTISLEADTTINLEEDMTISLEADMVELAVASTASSPGELLRVSYPRSSLVTSSTSLT